MSDISPGEWEYHPETESVIATCEGERVNVANVSLYETGIDLEQTNANGYAIAALPDVLAALIGLLSVSEPLHRSADEVGWSQCCAARAAIAKAKGG